MRLWRCAAAFVAVAVLVACARTSSPSSVPSADALTLAGQYVVPRDVAGPPERRVGGLSGLASLANGRELFAVADDRDHPRVFRMTVSAAGDPFRVDVSSIIYLKSGPPPPRS